MIRFKWISALLGLLMAMPGFAADNLGKTYPITEPDMLEEIQGKLKAMDKSGQLKQLQQEAINRSKNSIEHPRAVSGLTRTKMARTFYFDPTWRVPRDIVTPDGQVIARANDRVNPLDYMPLTKHLVFFDQGDPAQVKLAAGLIKKYDGRVKPILVAGEPLTLTRQWKQQVYFDQSGYLTRRFGITQVPALVSQENRRIRIDELEPK
ncbi:MAG: type-F conjugative transfer system protein TraW [Methylophilaceae bacterium]|nr:type-F conjugative transfer system protein TraW [Methylophilaceae bacterium]